MSAQGPREQDDLLLQEMAALAQLVDGAWQIATRAPDDQQDIADSHYQQAMVEWSALRGEVLPILGQSPVLARLRQRFGLSQWQLALVGLCALPQLEPRYQAVYADLHPNRQGVACLELLFNLLCADPGEKRRWITGLLSGSALLQWRLLIVPEGDSLTENYLLTAPVWLAPDLLQLFMGAQAGDVPDCTSGCLTRLPKPDHHCPPVTEHKSLPGVRLVQLHGDPGSGRQTLANSLSAHRLLWQLDGERLLQHSHYRSVFLDCLRHIALNDGELMWPEGSETLHDHAFLTRTLAQWLALPGNRCWLLETEARPWPAPLAALAPLTMALERPDAHNSTAIWQALAQRYLPDRPLADDALWTKVAHHYQMLPGAMLQVLLRLRSQLLPGQELTAVRVFRECLGQTPATLSGLATRVTPLYSMDDVIVNDDTHSHLQEIIHRYQQRQPLYERQLSSTRGLLTLFWGKPGTGKTMVAEALAEQLQLPLYKANLASISSKWIGETEKHLAALFDDAERHNGLLFFDEADAVFSRRSQVESSHDKNANLGVSYLLQRMEHFHGLLVLATNFKGNLDPAFMRRMHFSVEFTQPNAADRLKIWRHWLARVSTENNLDEAWLAKHLELSGAQIRNIVQHSAAQALSDGDRKIDRQILARSIYRESQKNDNSFLISTRLADWYDLRATARPFCAQGDDP